jgi:2-polyprenyl-3-methyl-5-hydroxy-6-metoxy-1,4-benzoquinol methylase
MMGFGKMLKKREAPTVGEWIVPGVDRQTAAAFLKRYEPWRMELRFESGPKASDFKTREPFQPLPLFKLSKILEHVSKERLQGARVLDVGFNMGYNSIHLASEFGCSVTGIDVERTHKTIAEEIAKMVGVEVEFLLASAEEFERRDEFDLILHLGTLYHLPNPIRSLERCFRSLRPGGWFALETVCYRGNSDRSLCKWVHGFGGDLSNFWALGEATIESVAHYCGISDLKLVFEAWPPVYKRELSRAIWIGRRPG